MLRIAVLLIALACAREASAHGGTSHSPEMSVENFLALSPGRVVVDQVHRCTKKVAEDIWRATDKDGDGALSDAEWAQGIEDSRAVYQQWCKLEVDWRTALPASVDVELTAFPRARPASFDAVQLTIKHRASYDASGEAPVRTMNFHCTSLNARTIRTTVRASEGVRVEQASAGTVLADGSGVTGIEQVDGTPDAVTLVVREPGAAPAGPGAPLTPRPTAPVSQTRGELAFALALLAVGFFKLVEWSVRSGRGEPKARCLAGIAAGFTLLGAGVYVLVHALVGAGILVIIIP